jgi:hypothetical protein
MHNGIRWAAAGVGALRVMLGLVAVGRPTLAARPWVGASHNAPATVVLARAAGARDIALGAGALAAVLRDDAGGTRGWTAAGAFCDLMDVMITLASWRTLPRTRALVAAAAGGAVVVGAAVVVADRTT